MFSVDVFGNIEIKTTRKKVKEKQYSFVLYEKFCNAIFQVLNVLKIDDNTIKIGIQMNKTVEGRTMTKYLLKSY